MIIHDPRCDPLKMYNSLRDERAHPPEVEVPESLSSPQSFEDYKAWSDLVRNAWEHARLLGVWCYVHNGGHNGRPWGTPDHEEIVQTAKRLIGLGAILATLHDSERLGYFRAFNNRDVTTGSLSVHVTMLRQARKQYARIEQISSVFRLQDYNWMCNLLPEEFVTQCGRSIRQVWHSNDCNKYREEVDAELERLKDKLKVGVKRSEPVVIVVEKNDGLEVRDESKLPTLVPDVPTSREPRDTRIRDELLPSLTRLEQMMLKLMWDRHIYTTFKELRKKWCGNTNNPKDDSIHKRLKDLKAKLFVVTSSADIDLTIEMSNKRAILVFARENTVVQTQ